MTTCRCTNLKHGGHLGRSCENLATEPDAYCKACHDHTERDRLQAEHDVRSVSGLSPE